MATYILLNGSFVTVTKLDLEKVNSYKFFYDVFKKDYENITPLSYTLFLVKMLIYNVFQF